jgi:hypothetical protein
MTTVWDYCDRHGIKRPNRCTTVQPAGTKSCSPARAPAGIPPKAQRYIRRITFRKNDPVALACIDYGYSVVPSQSDKDEHGNLLNDPFDPRCTEWLVEMPTEVSWANLPGADAVEIEQFHRPGPVRLLHAGAEALHGPQHLRHGRTAGTGNRAAGQAHHRAIQMAMKATSPPPCWPASMPTCKPSPGCPSSRSTRRLTTTWWSR